MKIKIWKRIKIPQSQLFHILQTNDPRASIPKNVPYKYMFFGTVILRCKGKSTWNVKWDVLPLINNVINNITRTKFTVVEDGEEEKGLPDNVQLDEVALDSDEGEGSPKKEA